MFEKLEEEIEVKADEYALEESTACNYGQSTKHVYQGYFFGFQKGAEFGYNKAFVEADKNLKAVVADFNKANEWHYVKDEDLPKDDIKLAIIEIDDCGYLLCNYRNGFWYDANSGATCAEWITNNIIAWKEIVLPKEEY